MSGALSHDAGRQGGVEEVVVCLHSADVPVPVLSPLTSSSPAGSVFEGSGGRGVATALMGSVGIPSEVDSPDEGRE